MSARSKAELAALAGSSVYSANQLISGISAHKHGEKDTANDHYLKAAAGAALAFTAYEMMQRKKDDEEYRYGKREERGYREIEYDHEHERGHNRRMLEQAAGMYALGKDLNGDKRHKGRHRAAEVLGAIGLLREARKHGH
ncbi:hypothetical protein TWF730_010261 [Orbilia blumenaviensis]|uniref:Uncharacterized protein n=1 Tax=Orbilia blumenaviensis TaxID=1796055 RepID=A0AAV9UU12_9PEZI